MNHAQIEDRLSALELNLPSITQIRREIQHVRLDIFCILHCAAEGHVFHYAGKISGGGRKFRCENCGLVYDKEDDALTEQERTAVAAVFRKT